MPEPIILNNKSFSAGDTVFAMVDNKPFETKVYAKNTLERFQNNVKTTKVEYFVENIEREVSIDEIFKTKEDLLKSL